jgi:hypothetical protein
LVFCDELKCRLTSPQLIPNYFRKQDVVCGFFFKFTLMKDVYKRVQVKLLKDLNCSTCTPLPLAFCGFINCYHNHKNNLWNCKLVWGHIVPSTTHMGLLYITAQQVTRPSICLWNWTGLNMYINTLWFGQNVFMILPVVSRGSV